MGKGGGKKANETLLVSRESVAKAIAHPEPATGQVANIPLPKGWEVSLDVVDGDDNGRTFAITKTCVMIGRATADIALSDAKVSRLHASIEVYGGGYVLLKDLGSTNGTTVNGKPVTTAELEDGDEIRVGTTRMLITIAVPP